MVKVLQPPLLLISVWVVKVLRVCPDTGDILDPLHLRMLMEASHQVSGGKSVTICLNFRLVAANIRALHWW